MTATHDDTPDPDHEPALEADYEAKGGLVEPPTVQESVGRWSAAAHRVREARMPAAEPAELEETRKHSLARADRAGRGSRDALFSGSTEPGIQRPQRGVPGPGEGCDAAAGLSMEPVAQAAGLWLVGAHGGAGETTLAQLDQDWAASDHTWPLASLTAGGDQARQECVLVARTHASGLRAAQEALTQWGSGQVDESVVLLGLVLIADAPGRLPRPLRDLATHVAGGAPRTWRLGWIEDWRQGEPVLTEPLPKPVQAILTDLRALTAAHHAQNIEKEED